MPRELRPYLKERLETQLVEFDYTELERRLMRAVLWNPRAVCAPDDSRAVKLKAAQLYRRAYGNDPLLLPMPKEGRRLAYQHWLYQARRWVVV